MTNIIHTFLECKNTIGESCFWDPRNNSLWWTDIQEKKIWCINENKKKYFFNIPDRAGFILPRKKEGFVIGFSNNVSISNQNLTEFTKLFDIESDMNETRINDAKVDPFGGIVFGTFDESDRDKRKPLGSVYRISPEGILTKLINKVTVSNGMAFSPNGEIMYFADTPTDTVRQFKIGNNFLNFDEMDLFISKGSAPGFPDGATVDAEGNYWSARVRGGCVAKFDSKGNLIYKITTPTNTPTCLAFGGKMLDNIFITSLTDLKSDDVHAGNLFRIQTKVIGNKQILSLL